MKKVVLFIVEGMSDKTAIEKILNKIYKNRAIKFEVTDGDISSREGVTKKNVNDKIFDIIQSFIRINKYKKKDIYQVIHIFDMDGAYIDDSLIFEGKTNYFLYKEDGIYCKDPNRVKERNKRKKEIMDFLLKEHEINGYPYEMYFFSCDLDHALYNKRNLEKELKMAHADKFYETFMGREESFIDFLKIDVENGTPSNFFDSWKYIREGKHSLERHTNLHLYFEKNPYF